MDKILLIIGAKVNPVGDSGDQNLEGDVTDILNNIILSIGIISVIVIIVGGVTYMTSAGDSNKTKKARDTILYACIGLIICVLSFAIVNFVIKRIIDNPSNYSSSKECKDADYTWKDGKCQ